MVNLLSRFRRSESGISMIEGLLVFPIMLLAITTFIEFGYGVFQWEQTGRAVAIGARLAAVSDPIVPAANFKTLGVTPAGSVTGAPVPSGVLRTSCTGASPGGSLALCDSTMFDRILFGSDDRCSPSFGTSVPGMCDVNARIKRENVIVTYTRDGLGYVGRESGPVVTVTVQLRNMSFQTILLGPLLGLDAMPMRPNPVTFTGEDLASCASPTRSADDYSTPCT